MPLEEQQPAMPEAAIPTPQPNPAAEATQLEAGSLPDLGLDTFNASPDSAPAAVSVFEQWQERERQAAVQEYQQGISNAISDIQACVLNGKTDEATARVASRPDLAVYTADETLMKSGAQDIMLGNKLIKACRSTPYDVAKDLIDNISDADKAKAYKVELDSTGDYWDAVGLVGKITREDIVSKHEEEQEVRKKAAELAAKQTELYNSLVSKIENGGTPTVEELTTYCQATGTNPATINRICQAVARIKSKWAITDIRNAHLLRDLGMIIGNDPAAEAYILDLFKKKGKEDYANRWSQLSEGIDEAGEKLAYYFGTPVTETINYFRNNSNPDRTVEDDATDELGQEVDIYSQSAKNINDRAFEWRARNAYAAGREEQAQAEKTSGFSQGIEGAGLFAPLMAAGKKQPIVMGLMSAGFFRDEVGKSLAERQDYERANSIPAGLTGSGADVGIAAGRTAIKTANLAIWGAVDKGIGKGFKAMAPSLTRKTQQYAIANMATRFASMDFLFGEAMPFAEEGAGALLEYLVGDPAHTSSQQAFRHTFIDDGSGRGAFLSRDYQLKTAVGAAVLMPLGAYRDWSTAVKAEREQKAINAFEPIATKAETAELARSNSAEEIVQKGRDILKKHLAEDPKGTRQKLEHNKKLIVSELEADRIVADNLAEQALKHEGATEVEKLPDGRYKITFEKKLDTPKPKTTEGDGKTTAEKPAPEAPKETVVWTPEQMTDYLRVSLSAWDSRTLNTLRNSLDYMAGERVTSAAESRGKAIFDVGEVADKEVQLALHQSGGEITSAVRTALGNAVARIHAALPETLRVFLPTTESIRNMEAAVTTESNRQKATGQMEQGLTGDQLATPSFVAPTAAGTNIIGLVRGRVKLGDILNDTIQHTIRTLTQGKPELLRGIHNGMLNLQKQIQARDPKFKLLDPAAEFNEQAAIEAFSKLIKAHFFADYDNMALTPEARALCDYAAQALRSVQADVAFAETLRNWMQTPEGKAFFENPANNLPRLLKSHGIEVRDIMETAASASGEEVKQMAERVNRDIEKPEDSEEGVPVPPVDPNDKEEAATREEEDAVLKQEAEADLGVTLTVRPRTAERFGTFAELTRYKAANSMVREANRLINRLQDTLRTNPNADTAAQAVAAVDSLLLQFRNNPQLKGYLPSIKGTDFAALRRLQTKWAELHSKADKLGTIKLEEADKLEIIDLLDSIDRETIRPYYEQQLRDEWVASRIQGDTQSAKRNFGTLFNELARIAVRRSDAEKESAAAFRDVMEYMGEERAVRLRDHIRELSKKRNADPAKIEQAEEIRKLMADANEAQRDIVRAFIRQQLRPRTSERNIKLMGEMKKLLTADRKKGRTLISQLISSLNRPLEARNSEDTRAFRQLFDEIQSGNQKALTPIFKEITREHKLTGDNRRAIRALPKQERELVTMYLRIMRKKFVPQETLEEANAYKELYNELTTEQREWTDLISKEITKAEAPTPEQQQALADFADLMQGAREDARAIAARFVSLIRQKDANQDKAFLNTWKEIEQAYSKNELAKIREFTNLMRSAKRDIGTQQEARAALELFREANNELAKNTTQNTDILRTRSIPAELREEYENFVNKRLGDILAQDPFTAKNNLRDTAAVRAALAEFSKKKLISTTSDLLNIFRDSMTRAIRDGIIEKIDNKLATYAPKKTSSGKISGIKLDVATRDALSRRRKLMDISAEEKETALEELRPLLENRENADSAVTSAVNYIQNRINALKADYAERGAEQEELNSTELQNLNALLEKAQAEIETGNKDADVGRFILNEALMLKTYGDFRNMSLESCEAAQAEFYEYAARGANAYTDATLKRNLERAKTRETITKEISMRQGVGTDKQSAVNKEERAGDKRKNAATSISTQMADGWRGLMSLPQLLYALEGSGGKATRAYFRDLGKSLATGEVNYRKAKIALDRARRAFFKANGIDGKKLLRLIASPHTKQKYSITVQAVTRESTITLPRDTAEKLAAASTEEAYNAITETLPEAKRPSYNDQSKIQDFVASHSGDNKALTLKTERTIEAHERQLGLGEMLDAVLRSESGDYFEQNYEYWGYTRDVITQMENLLDAHAPGALQYGREFLRPMLNNMERQRIFLEETGYPLPLVKNYWPGRWKSLSEVQEAFEASHQAAFTPVRYSDTIGRVKHRSEPTFDLTAEQTFQLEWQMQQNYINYSRTSARLRNDLGDKNFANAIASNLSAHEFSRLKLALNALDGCLPAEAATTMAVNRLGARYMAARAGNLLLGRPTTWLKQISGILNATGYEGFNAAKLGMMMVKHPFGVGAHKSLSDIAKLDAFRTRIGDKNVTSILAETAGRNANVSQLRAWTDSTLGRVTELVDAAGNLFGSTMLYNYKYEEMVSNFRKANGREPSKAEIADIDKACEDLITHQLALSAQPLTGVNKTLYAYLNPDNFIRNMLFMGGEVANKVGMTQAMRRNELYFGGQLIKGNSRAAKIIRGTYSLIKPASFYMSYGLLDQLVLVGIDYLKGTAPGSYGDEDWDAADLEGYIAANAILGMSGLSLLAFVPIIGTSTNAAVTKALFGYDAGAGGAMSDLMTQENTWRLLNKYIKAANSNESAWDDYDTIETGILSIQLASLLFDVLSGGSSSALVTETGGVGYAATGIANILQPVAVSLRNDAKASRRVKQYLEEIGVRESRKRAKQRHQRQRQRKKSAWSQWWHEAIHGED